MTLGLTANGGNGLRCASVVAASTLPMKDPVVQLMLGFLAAKNGIPRIIWSLPRSAI